MGQVIVRQCRIGPGQGRERPGGLEQNCVPNGTKVLIGLWSEFEYV